MRLTSMVLASVALAFAACGVVPALGQATDQHAIDPAKSTAQFSIEHIFVDRVTGSVPVLSGTVTFAPGTTMPESVSAALDATRLRTDERDRDASLTGPDYFDTRRFPTWTFTSTKITPTGPAAFTMDGLLTMHGVAQPEHLDVVVRDGAHPLYHAVGRIDRHAFGMRGARLDPVIGNTADVTLDIVVQ